MFPTINGHVKKQISALFRSPEKLIQVKIMDMHMQCGISDCGLFAIATATALGYGGIKLERTIV